MSTSQTPRTDEAQFGTGRVSVDFARTLERELTAAKAEVEKLKQMYDEQSRELIERGKDIDTLKTALHEPTTKLLQLKKQLDESGLMTAKYIARTVAWKVMAGELIDYCICKTGQDIASDCGECHRCKKKAAYQKLLKEDGG